MEPLAWDGPLPKHLAIIMDGNGRWANARGLSRGEGHKQGAETVRMVVRTCRRLGVDALTLYAFSAQNWNRPREEVTALMELLHDYVQSERSEIMDNDIRFNCIGELSAVPSLVRKAIEGLMLASRDNTGMTLTLAVSYGAREEMLEAMRTLGREVARGELDPESLDQADINRSLWTCGLPSEVDLLIRTSGELRLSNFLLWQTAYAELWFTDTCWPEFTKESLLEALRSYGARDRRFGQLGSKAC